MPKIPVFTATGTQGINALSAGVPKIADPTPAAFGAEGFKGMSTLGGAFLAIDAKMQEQNERLGLVKMATDFGLQLDKIKADAINQPTPELGAKYLQDESEKALKEVEKQHTSNSQLIAIRTHAQEAWGRASIEVATEGRKRLVEKTIANYDAQSDRLTSLAASAATDEEAVNYLQQDKDLRAGLTAANVLSPKDAAARAATASNRFWELKAMKNPEMVMGIFADVSEGASHPADMDPQKLGHYYNIAVGTLNARHTQRDNESKAQEAQVKATQQQNANLITADILEGKPGATANIPALLRARGIDDGVARTLVELHQKMSTAPDMTKYQSGLAAQIEATLSAMKYSPEALQDGLEQGLVSDFTEGRILKTEFTHLMGVFREVESHKQQSGKELSNREVNHAHDNLVGRLKTTGPADKFDALSEQTVKEAEQFFYRRMAQQPNADPWAVMQEAEKIFKPVIEKRLGVNSADQQKLDDAKMKALRQSGAISAAGYKAWKDGADQANAGRAIVEETIKALPPPPQPGFLERMNPFGKKGEQPKAAPKPRKKPGFFGGE